MLLQLKPQMADFRYSGVRIRPRHKIRKMAANLLLTTRKIPCLLQVTRFSTYHKLFNNLRSLLLQYDRKTRDAQYGFSSTNKITDNLITGAYNLTDKFLTCSFANLRVRKAKM